MDGIEFNAPVDTVKVISEAVFIANHLTDTDKQNSTDKQTQYKSKKVNNLKYSTTKLRWFSCLLQHSARKRCGLILQLPRAHTGQYRCSAGKNNKFLSAASSNLLQRTGSDHQGGRAKLGRRTFLVTCLRWILGYTRLEIWRKIGLSGD